MLDKQEKCDLLTYNSPHYRKQKRPPTITIGSLIIGSYPPLLLNIIHNM